jgi:hypothetical protein
MNLSEARARAEALYAELTDDWATTAYKWSEVRTPGSPLASLWPRFYALPNRFYCQSGHHRLGVMDSDDRRGWYWRVERFGLGVLADGFAPDRGQAMQEAEAAYAAIRTTTTKKTEETTNDVA